MSSPTTSTTNEWHKEKHDLEARLKALESHLPASGNPVSTPGTTPYNEWQKEKQELQNRLKEQAEQLGRQDAQIEKLQLDIEAKITRSKDLEDQLAQAIELAHSRDARLEELMEKFDQMLSRQDNLSTTATSDNPSTPARVIVASESPPSKKANTNATPDRQVYAVFRRPPGRQVERTNLMDRYNLPSTAAEQTLQQMDTDDESSSKPAARPGKKTE